MINPNVYLIASAHADALREVCNQAVIPASNSVMSMLMNDSYMLTGSTGESKTVADILAAATSDDLSGPSDHSSVMGARIDTLIPLVAGHIDFIQNVVTPDVRRFDETLQAAVGKLDNISPTQEFNIVQTSIPEVLNIEDFKGLVERYANENMNVPGVITNFPPQSPEQMYAAMRVTSSTVNAAMGRWIATLGDEWFMDLWANYFAGANVAPAGTRSKFSPNFNTIGNLPTFDRLNVATALFLLARGYKDDPIDGAGMSLNEYTRVLDDVSRFAGAQVRSGLFHADMITRQKQVVVGVSENGKVITVNTPFYVEFLEAGGDETILLGATMATGAKTISLDTLQSSDVNYSDIWRNYQAMNQSSLNAAATVSLRAVAKAAFSDCVRGISDEEKQVLDLGQKNATVLEAEATKCIEQMTLNDLRDTRCAALCLVAGIRYGHTPAKQFLQDMFDAEQAGCESPQEAALIAALNYVADAQAFELALVPA